MVFYLGLTLNYLQIGKIYIILMTFREANAFKETLIIYFKILLEAQVRFFSRNLIAKFLITCTSIYLINTPARQASRQQIK